MTETPKAQPERGGLVSITIENSDLSAMVTEYAQENAQLRLTVKALVRRVNALEVKLAAIDSTAKPTESKEA